MTTSVGVVPRWPAASTLVVGRADGGHAAQHAALEFAPTFDDKSAVRVLQVQALIEAGEAALQIASRRKSPVVGLGRLGQHDLDLAAAHIGNLVGQGQGAGEARSLGFVVAEVEAPLLDRPDLGSDHERARNGRSVVVDVTRGRLDAGHRVRLEPEIAGTAPAVS